MVDVPRTATRNIDVKLYDDDLSTPTLVEDLTFRVEGLKFSTKLHGGFASCSFNLKADLPEAWEWITDKMFYRLLVSDVERVLFEGRIEDISISAGSVGVTANGYYANLGDIPYNTAYNAVASVVIKAVLTANCAQINADQTNIDATDITIVSTADATYRDIYPDMLVAKLLDFSDTNKYKYYFAIWEDRIPYLKARSVSTLDWQVNLGELSQFKLRHRGGKLWNAAYAVYLAAGVITRTADADDTTSQAKYFERKCVVRNLGTVAQATAEAQRDSIVEEHKDIYPYMENVTLGPTVSNANDVPYPSYWVRAGDVIRIRDLVPASADAGTVTRDALRTFYILGTDYDATKCTNRLTLDTESGSLTEQLKGKLSILDQLSNKS